MKKHYLTNNEIMLAVELLHTQIMSLCSNKDGEIRVYGVPRGGIPVAYALQRYGRIEVVDDPATAMVIVDDILDSGATRDRYRDSFVSTPFLPLYTASGTWLVFPWENGSTDSSADDIPLRLLQFIGEDPERGGLLETPKRFLKAWEHYSSGYGVEPADVLKVFKDGAEDYDELVLVKDIPVYSHCEHHLAPFFGVAHVGYIPSGSIVGLSKLSRLVDIFARRLQVQERMTSQIAQAIEDSLKPKGVAVVIECRHLCMEARGIQRQGSSTVTSSMRGVFRANAAARAEFMGLLK